MSAEMFTAPMGAYFYPLTTKCPERTERGRTFGQVPVDETHMAQTATPLFTNHPEYGNHRQPRTYCLGEPNLTRWDDSEPSTMARQVELAKNYGLDFFVFDTYVGLKKGEPRKEMAQPLDNAFLGLTESRRDFNFALMLVLASPRVVLPVPLQQQQESFFERDRFYDLSKEAAEFTIDKCHQYWQDPNYLHINNKPYVSIFPSNEYPDTNEVSKTQSVNRFVKMMREYAWKKYKEEPYMAMVAKDVTIGQEHAFARDLADSGADAITGYVSLPDFGKNAPSVQIYDDLYEYKKDQWRHMQNAIVIPFVPPITIGWDASPRGERGRRLDEITGQYPYTPIVIGDTPEKFGRMLDETTLFIAKHVPESERYRVIFSWNEVTEGGVLLPERRADGSVDFRMLEQVKRQKRLI